MRFRIFFLFLLCATLFVGCGNSSPSPYAASEGQTVFAPTSVAGRVAPGVAVSGVPVVVTSESGQVLAQTTTDESGAFLFYGFAGPENFLVTATISADLVLECQVSGNPGGAYVVLNIPTTLAARLARSGGLTAEQAKQRVATFLEIKSTAELEHGLSEYDGAGFSHLAFFLRAQQNGGADAFVDLLILQLQAASTPQPFRLTLDDLDLPLNLPAPLLSRLREIQADPALRRAILASRLREMPHIAGLILDGTTQAQPKAINYDDVRASFIVDTLLNQVLDVTWTHIADSANLNYGTTAMLARIQDQLGEVLDVLTQMNLTIGKQNLDNAVSDVYNQAISQIETYNSRLANLNLSNILAAPETPYTPANDTQQLLNSMQSLATEQNLRIIRNYLDPTTQGTKILVDAQSYLLSDLYGQSLTADTGNFPFRNSSLINQLFSILDYYSGYQQLGINLLGESAHIQTNPTNAIGTAQRNAEETIGSLYRQRAILPPTAKLPNNVVVDLQAGLMWHTVIFDARSCSDAISFANSFTLSDGSGGTYTDWHLPTLQEYRILRERARHVATSLRDPNVKHDGDNPAAGNFGYSAQGLPALGFSNTSALNSDGSVLYSDYTYSVYEADGYRLEGTGTFDRNPEFRFNHEKSYRDSTTDKRPFFVVRSIGKPVVPVASTIQDGSGTRAYIVDVDSVSAPIPYDWSDVKDFEYELFGRVNGVKDLAFLVPSDSSDGLPDRVGGALTYQFATGGTITVGGSTYPVTFPRRNYDSAAAGHSFPTYNGPANAYTEVNTRNQLVSFASRAETFQRPGEAQAKKVMELAPTGRVRWNNQNEAARSFDVSAFVYSTSGVAQEIPASISTSVSRQRKLTQIQIFPRNREYFLTSIPSTSEQYYCLAFFSDDTVEDVTNKVIWSAVDQSTGQSATGASFSSQANGYLTVDNTAPGFVQAKVTYDPAPLGSMMPTSAEDQTVIKIVTQ